MQTNRREDYGLELGADDEAGGQQQQPKVPKKQKKIFRAAGDVVAELRSDSSRMSAKSFFWAGLIVLIATAAAHLWIIQGMSNNGSIYYVDHEVYSYIFDYLSFSFTMPSRLVGGCIGLGASFLWLGGLMLGLLKSKGNLCQSWANPVLMENDGADRLYLTAFRFLMWMANVSVLLSLGPLTGTNDFFQLLMISFTEAACAHSILNIHRIVRAAKSGEQQSLVGRPGGSASSGDGWLTYLIIFVSWLIPHVVVGFNMFAIFDGNHAMLSGTDRVSVTALFATWTTVVVFAKLYVTISVKNGDGWITTTDATDNGIVVDSDESAWAAEVVGIKEDKKATKKEQMWADLEKINKTHIGKAITALFFIALVLMLYAFSVAIAISAKTSVSQSHFRGRLQLEWHTGSAAARNGSVITQNNNFVTHSYTVNAFWMMFVATFALFVVFVAPTFSVHRLKTIINKAKTSRPDLLTYSFTGLAAGLMNAYALAASGFNDPVTMISVTALTTAGFAMISRVRAAYTGSVLLWLMSFIICALPVVVIAESVFMTPWGTSGFSSKWDLIAHGGAHKAFSIIHWVFALLETLLTVMTTSPVLPFLQRDPFIRFWLFFAVQCSVVFRVLYTISHGHAAVFYA